MRSIMIAVALVVVLAATSTASAGWTYVAPPVVYGGYYPVGPVYAYPGAVPVVVGRPIVAGPVVAPAPAYYPAAPVVYGYPYGYPYAVRTRVFVPGQPVRNTLRAAFP